MDYIIIEPTRLADETGRWITVGNCLHKTSMVAGLASICSGKFCQKSLKKYKYYYFNCRIDFAQKPNFLWIFLLYFAFLHWSLYNIMGSWSCMQISSMLYFIFIYSMLYIFFVAGWKESEKIAKNSKSNRIHKPSSISPHQQQKSQVPEWYNLPLCIRSLRF